MEGSLNSALILAAGHASSSEFVTCSILALKDATLNCTVGPETDENLIGYAAVEIAQNWLAITMSAVADLVAKAVEATRKVCSSNRLIVLL